MNITYHGHSFVQIQTDDVHILIDPFIEGNPACDITLDDVVQGSAVDAVILTHGHSDHIGSTAQIVAAHGATLITTYELGFYMQAEYQIEKTSTHSVGGGVQYDGFHVKFFQAWHGGGIGGDMSHQNTTIACGIILSMDDKVIYHAGDTGLFGDMKLLDELYDIDLAFLPIGDRYTMGVDDAVIACKWIQPTHVVPVHYDTRPIIAADADSFAQRVADQATSQPHILKPGSSLSL